MILVIGGNKSDYRQKVLNQDLFKAMGGIIIKYRWKVANTKAIKILDKGCKFMGNFEFTERVIQLKHLEWNLDHTTQIKVIELYQKSFAFSFERNGTSCFQNYETLIEEIRRFI